MKKESKAKILELLATHRIMTVATLRPDGWPQATTVGYVNEGLTIYFLCGLDSQKARNISRDDRISLTIDHDTPDLMAITGLSMAARATAVTMTGPVFGLLFGWLIFGTPPAPVSVAGTIVVIAAVVLLARRVR